MRTVLSIVVAVLIFVSATARVCSPVSVNDRGSLNSSAWAFSVAHGESYSCASSAGGVNDLGHTPEMCQNDPASVRIQLTPGLAECLVAKAYQCKIPMHDFTSLDYDFEVEGCDGVWAAPLWVTPDKWQFGGPKSGEIDSLEFCPRDKIQKNFAGGGHQAVTNFSMEQSSGHITVRKDTNGILTIASCDAVEAAANGGQCVAPVYADCKSCLLSSNAYSCWCNSGRNIYDSGGCQNGGDCMWTLVSDIWNGVKGDSGYDFCMAAVSHLGLEARQPNYKSSCAFSVERILLRGSGPNQSLQFGPGSSSGCSILTTQA